MEMGTFREGDCGVAGWEGKEGCRELFLFADWK